MISWRWHYTESVFNSNTDIIVLSSEFCPFASFQITFVASRLKLVFKTIFPARSAHFWMMDICWAWNMFKMSLCFTISWPGGHFCKTSKAVEKGSEWWPRMSNCKCKDKTVCFWKVMITWEMQCIEGLGGINAVCRASYRRKREEWQIKFCVLLWCSVIRCDVAL